MRCCRDDARGSRQARQARPAVLAEETAAAALTANWSLAWYLKSKTRVCVRQRSACTTFLCSQTNVADATVTALFCVDQPWKSTYLFVFPPSVSSCSESRGAWLGWFWPQAIESGRWGRARRLGAGWEGAHGCAFNFRRRLGGLVFRGGWVSDWSLVSCCRDLVVLSLECFFWSW